MTKGGKVKKSMQADFGSNLLQHERYQLHHSRICLTSLDETCLV